MSLYNYHSEKAAPCGVGKCVTRFHTEIEWAYHCKEKHPKFFKDNKMAEKFQLNESHESNEVKHP